MNEPYRLLFAGYQDHWLIGQYLPHDWPEPDWDGLLNDPQLGSLSSGEKVLVDIACWFAGPLRVLDVEHRVRIAQALLLTCEP